MSFGQWLRDARKTRRLTQRGLADLAGISFSMVSRLENDEVGHSPDMVKRIADALATGESEEERERVNREARAASAGIEPTATPEESEFVRAMLSATPEQKALIRAMLESWGLGIGVEEL